MKVKLVKDSPYLYVGLDQSPLYILCRDLCKDKKLLATNVTFTWVEDDLVSWCDYQDGELLKHVVKDETL